MIYVLIFWAGVSAPRPSITATGTAEFATLQACEAAASTVKQQVALPQYNMIFGSTCQPKR